MKNRNSKKGFTLVEIMIVVVIIGLLAAMAIPAFQKVRQNSIASRMDNDARQIASAAQQYFLEQGADSVASNNLVGTETDRYIRTVQTVRGETYPSTINSTDSQLVAASAAGDVAYPP